MANAQVKCDNWYEIYIKCLGSDCGWTFHSENEGPHLSLLNEKFEEHNDEIHKKFEPSEVMHTYVPGDMYDGGALLSVCGEVGRVTGSDVTCKECIERMRKAQPERRDRARRAKAPSATGS